MFLAGKSSMKNDISFIKGVPMGEVFAALFAHKAHASVGQVRMYTGEPYVCHPKAVVEIVRSVPHTPSMILSAWLHDTVEDTGITLEMIGYYFGDEVADMVEMLTDVSKPEDGNRAIRKAIDLAHTAKASPSAKTIKLADLIDNSSTILARDPVFAKIYLEEKRRLLEVLHEGDRTLWLRACEIAYGGMK